MNTYASLIYVQFTTITNRFPSTAANTLPPHASGRLARRGAMVVLLAAVMTVFAACTVLMLDLGYIQLTRANLRSATDAAARAAAEALSRLQNTDAAVQAAKDIAAANDVAGEPLLLCDDDVAFGHATRLESGAWTFSPGNGQVNAVRVLGRRTADSLSGSVGLFFARLFGRECFEPTQTATVINLDRDICLVVDRSSSMKLYLNEVSPTMSTGDARFCQPPHPTNSRWAALKEAVHTFTEELESTVQTEYVGLVSYSSNVNYCGFENIASSTDQPINPDPALTNQAMAVLTNSVFNGATNIAAGIDAGTAALTDPAHTRRYAAKTMLLFTDGHATAGRSPVLAATDAAQRGIVVHTVTFGDGANETDMIAVAKATGGRYYHAPDAQNLHAIFREIALTLPIVFTD